MHTVAKSFKTVLLTAAGLLFILHSPAIGLDQPAGADSGAGTISPSKPQESVSEPSAESSPPVVPAPTPSEAAPKPPPVESKTEPPADQRTPVSGDETDLNKTEILLDPNRFFDISTGRFGLLEIALQDASFMDAHVDNLHILSRKMNLAEGTLQSLNIEVDGGEFQDFHVDRARLATNEILQFDPNALFDKHVLEFAEPARAQVSVDITQASLNSFLNSPRILKRLSGAAKRKVPILSQLTRQDVRFGLEFVGGTLKLQEDNKIHVSIGTRFGVGKLGLPVPMSADTKLALQDGWVVLTETKLQSSGQQLPEDMAERIVSKINSLVRLAGTDDLKFRFTELNVIPGDRFHLSGTAEIKKLRFGRAPNGTAGGTTPEPEVRKKGQKKRKRKKRSSEIK